MSGISGNIKKIPCEIYSRSVGYYRPVDQWNKGKQEEFRSRHQHDPERISKLLNKDGDRDDAL